jgi:hypothetical protein
MTESEIRAQLLKYWMSDTIEIWRRAGYKCEYCSKSMITHSDDYFHNSNIDHIVPGAGNGLCNLALACRTCNNIKRATPFVEPGEIWPSNDVSVRSKLIARAAQHIAALRSRNQGRMERELEWLRQLDEIAPWSSAPEGRT